MMEMSDIEAISASSGKSVDEVLASLKEQGLVGVAITEETVRELVIDGVATISKTSDDSGFISTLSDSRISNAVATKRPSVYESTTSSLSTHIRVETDPKNLLDLTIGIDESVSSSVVSNELLIIARLLNYRGADETGISFSLKQAHENGATSYLIAGDQAIGNRELISTTAEVLEEFDMNYLSPEFVTLGGDGYLRRELANRTLRLHSISVAEAEKMSQATLDERFAKAFRERGVRWLLLRPSTKASEDTLAQVGNSLASIRGAINRAGGEVKKPRPFEDPNVPAWLIGVIALLAVPAVTWAVIQIFGLNVLGKVLAAGVVLVGAGAFFGYEKQAALMIATMMPVVGYLYALSQERVSPIRDAVIITLVSLVGGMCVGGMLTGNEYMLRADAFAGVKLAMFGPLLFVGVLLLRREGSFSELIRKPVTWGAATVTLLGLAGLLFISARTGNDNPGAVSGIELQIRSLLDQLLFVRPRSKEFLLGHPALILGLCLAAYRPDLRQWSSLLLLVGVIGQTSVVNTLCHLHTPIALSLVRVGVGLLGGGIIALLLWAVIKQRIPARESSN